VKLLSTVMRGLDPRIHLLASMMDGRVKPGHDDGVVNVIGECSKLDGGEHPPHQAAIKIVRA
jgi:hypothetical protein